MNAQTALNPNTPNVIAISEKLQSQPENQTRPKSKLVALDIGNFATKCAMPKVGKPAKLASIPTAVLEVPNPEEYACTFEYKGTHYTVGTEALESGKAEKMVYSLASLAEARKVEDFGLYFRAILAKLTNPKKLGQIQRFKFALSTSAAKDSYSALAKEAEKVATLKINGEKFEYAIEIIGIFPEGFGVGASQNTQGFTKRGILFDRTLLLDFGQGTLIVSRYDSRENLNATASGSAEDNLVSRFALGQGCIQIGEDWVEWATPHYKNVAPNQDTLFNALLNPLPDGNGYHFGVTRKLNWKLNEILVKVIEKRWETLKRNPQLAKALRGAEHRELKIYACGGGALLMRSVLEAEEIEIVPNPGFANAIGMANWLQANASKGEK